MDQQPIALHVLRKINVCADGKVCPALIVLSTQPDHTAVVGKVSGTPGVVYIPETLIPEAVDLPVALGWPGHRIMVGQPVLDPVDAAALSEHVGPGEAVLLVRNDQLPGVFQRAA